MEIKTHFISNVKIAELISDEMIINHAEDGLDLLGDIYYQSYEKII